MCVCVCVLVWLATYVYINVVPIEQTQCHSPLAGALDIRYGQSS